MLYRCGSECKPAGMCFAYTHYSQLFEDPAVAVFRAAWIEQLGDLARYRICRDDGVTHPFEQLMERDLPQSGRDVVPLRQRVQAGGD
jgi:hypothetical protein